MTQEERFNTRERSYSAWHRRLSTQRFVGIERAQTLAMIDLDASLYVEYDDGTKEPLALIETARDVGQEFKNATVTTNLSKACTRRIIPAYLVLYTLSSEKNPADPKWNDIEFFRVKRLWPKPEKRWTILTPMQWCKRLVQLREWSSSRVDEIISQGG